MPSQEERLLAVEQTQSRLGQSVRDLNHHTGMVEGILVKQGLEVREIRNAVRAIDSRLLLLEMNVNNRFEAVENRFNSMEQSINSRFDLQANRLETVENRLDSIDDHLGSLDQKFDQVLQMLTTLTNKPKQGA